MKASFDADVIRRRDRYYILASSALADDRTRVLKHGETFAVFDRHGDVRPLGHGHGGLYHDGTRFLSRLELTLNGRRPLLLSSTVLDDNTRIAVDLTNPDLLDDARLVVPRGTLHVFRSKHLHQGVCRERIRVSNFGTARVELRLVLRFEADFADVFEVRGSRRARRGWALAPRRGARGAALSYRGLDGRTRTLSVRWRPERGVSSRAPDPGTVEFRAVLAARAEAAVDLAFSCAGRPEASRAAFDASRRGLLAERRLLARAETRVETSNEQFNDWLGRSRADMHMMCTRMGSGGYYPYAGVPWFSTVFGRDGVLTALFCLWWNPALARGVLDTLARLQARRADPARDAEPGKIAHETRRGEMAALGEVPFGLYYGSADVTPLFVVLAAAYWERTADAAFARRLWPAVERALGWMERYGDADGDGFIEYGRKKESGLANQGWKDSEDAVFHADGAPARGPIALCEVQGYAYAALARGADLAAALGHPGRAEELRARAARLRERFHAAFWRPGLGLYALALDGRKHPCLVRSSNAGHCLYSGIAKEAVAGRLVRELLSPRFFSGWGVRTVAFGEARYNPLSYHNGSVWPHDNALIAAGMARYGFKAEAARVLQGLFDASLFMDLHRLPELFCGLPRRAGEGPTLYPVACSPQAWASASVFLLLASILGLSIDAARGRVFFDHPHLPPFLSEVRLWDLRAGAGSADLVLRRHRGSVGIEVAARRGAVEVAAVA